MFPNVGSEPLQLLDCRCMHPGGPSIKAGLERGGRNMPGGDKYTRHEGHPGFTSTQLQQHLASGGGGRGGGEGGEGEGGLVKQH